MGVEPISRVKKTMPARRHRARAEVIVGEEDVASRVTEIQRRPDEAV